jgi:hypothetical protein
MAEFKLGRLRFVWQGSWITSHAYVKDDIVKYGGRTYVCLVGHTSGAFYSDLTAATPKWTVMSDGVSWAGSWAPSTVYKENDIIKFGAYFKCNC